MPNETHAAETQVMHAPLLVHDGASDLATLRAEPIEAEVFTEGDRLYRAMLASIRDARRMVRMEGYVFADDEIGWEFPAALSGRAHAGVVVRVHLDATADLRQTLGSLALRRRRTAEFLLVGRPAGVDARAARGASSLGSATDAPTPPGALKYESHVLSDRLM